jgi:hypothetical protein
VRNHDDILCFQVAELERVSAELAAEEEVARVAAEWADREKRHQLAQEMLNHEQRYVRLYHRASAAS